MPKIELYKNKCPSLASHDSLARELNSQGYDTPPLFWADDPGAVYDAHSHHHDEFIVVNAGSITFSVDGVNYQLEAGDALCLPAGTVHEAQVDEERGARYCIYSRQVQTRA